MARGWESKNVEEQQDAANTPAAVLKEPGDANKQHRLESLKMQRERVLEERTSSPHRRSALEMALADIERELEQLGWTIHI